MKRIVIFLLMLALFPLSAFAETECEICKELGERGFPEEYREPLCALALLHPQWEFEPLLITELSREKGEEYDFSCVVAAETASGRSLVLAKEEYSAYGDREALFDTGYYDATRDAVAYFLDPRNFLSEKGVFQFLVITGSGFSSEGIQKELEGSTVAQVKDIDKLLLNTGEKTGLDPLFLASRLRQEQGAAGTPLFWGTAGSTLAHWYGNGVESENGKWIHTPKEGYDKDSLKALDGFFNPFHAETSGQGAFQVYYNGVTHAKNQDWDSLEKGLMGGAEKMQKEYAACYQNTLYLQKWNVDIRSVTEDGGSRNFWGQYMQNIGAAKTEGDRLFESYREAGRLEGKLSFSIPVYEGIGEKNPDPAGGACPVFAADESLESSHLYSKEVLSPDTVPDATGPIREEPDEEDEPFWWVAVILGTVAVSVVAWRLAWIGNGKKGRNIRHFQQKK